ncbi:MAG: cation:proton antiporter, partial [Pirellulaceae bacterium]|nr:cation:proton antiporter [Pirellulaceae bacterium]
TSSSNADVMLHVLFALASVILLGAILGWLCRYIGQPPVIGEVLAGLSLGPSLLGAISPDAMQLLIPSAILDPKDSVATSLKVMAQLGVLLYMFLVGLELNAAKLKHKAHAAVAISHASIVVPFALGTILALWLYPMLSDREVPFVSFSLFLGVAMSVTAFPVLARILTDRNLQNTPVGTVALSCAAADDVTAWCLLSLVVGVAKAEVGNAIFVIGGALAFILFMFFIAKPLLNRYIISWDRNHDGLPTHAIASVYVMILGAAAMTEWIGIHAIFGAFLLGVVISSESSIAKSFQSKLKEPVTVLLLPAFFAYTGMRTEIGLLNDWSQWLVCMVIILVATAGKFGGTFLAARYAGESWREAGILGMLMNTRGLMELIVLNIGLDLGVISPTLFAMMVIMALVTTMTTAPALQFLIPTDNSTAERPVKG